MSGVGGGKKRKDFKNLTLSLGLFGYLIPGGLPRRRLGEGDTVAALNGERQSLAVKAKEAIGIGGRGGRWVLELRIFLVKFIITKLDRCKILVECRKVFELIITKLEVEGNLNFEVENLVMCWRD